MQRSSVSQVPAKLYDRNFFAKVYGSDNESVDFDQGLSKDYYQEMVNIIKPSQTSFLVDYGCGNGTLSFLLWKKYKTRVLGIDYSKDAIAICKSRLKRIKSNYLSHINFKVANNNKLPTLKGVTHVYFCDVIEHMYDHEIQIAISTIKTWSTKPITIIFHTDNNFYLKFIRPILNIFYLVSYRKSFADLRQEVKEEKAVHVNLTNFIKLKHQMESLGLHHIKTRFPVVTDAKIGKQLGPLAKYSFVFKLSRYILHLFPFFSPSFFSVFTTGQDYTHED